MRLLISLTVAGSELFPLLGRAANLKCFIAAWIFSLSMCKIPLSSFIRWLAGHRGILHMGKDLSGKF